MGDLIFGLRRARGDVRVFLYGLREGTTSLLFQAREHRCLRDRDWIIGHTLMRKWIGPE